MSENAKNTLQVYCQKKGLALPRYNAYFNETTRKWISTVSLIDIAFTGDAEQKKSHADISAAIGVCMKLGLYESKPALDIITVHKYNTLDLIYPKKGDTDPMYILVDYENVNRLDHMHNTFTNKDGYPAYVGKFVGYCNQKADTDEPTHIIPIHGSNAVDHFISFYLGMLVQCLLMGDCKINCLTIILLTGDGFGAHHKFLTGERDDLTVHHCRSEKTAIGILEKHNYKETNIKYQYVNVT